MDANEGAVVVGTSYGVLAHVGALRDAGLDVIALVGRDAGKARSRAEKLGIPHGLNDLDQALSLDDTLARAWDVLLTLPRGQLAMLPAELLDEHAAGTGGDR